MTVYQLNRECAHLLLERPGITSIVNKQGGMKNSYTKSELLHMLFPKEINALIEQGVLVGPPVGKNESASSSNSPPERMAERRKRLAEEVLGPYFDGSNPAPREVYLFLRSPEHASLSRSVYPHGVNYRALERDLKAIPGLLTL